MRRRAEERAALARLREDVGKVDPAEALADALSLAYTAVAGLRDSHGDDPAKLELFGAWLDRVGRLSKFALDARVDERHLRVVQAYGDQMVALLRTFALGLGFGVDDPHVVAVMRSSLMELSGGQGAPRIVPLEGTVLPALPAAAGELDG